ncbi:hypothetical protein PZE06_29435, partial [Robertmurraya sp. DFI.2.37]|uniref:hypothetical protein n=1 Tax=Robertmurraya sp. DFI.2.37 TaxID=3031819 RepID=UPI0023DBF7D3
QASRRKRTKTLRDNSNGGGRMKYVNYFFAIYWAVLFALFVAGVFEPDAVTIGCALLLSALNFVNMNSVLEAR